MTGQVLAGVRSEAWRQIEWVGDHLETFCEYDFTVLLHVVHLEDLRRAALAGFDPWRELRQLLRDDRVEFSWIPMKPTRGMCVRLPRGRHRIILNAGGMSRARATEVLAHELEHRRRDYLYGGHPDPRVTAEEEMLVDAYSRARFGQTYVPVDLREAVLAKRKEPK